jgi:2-C-methyl-D-erythritol 4-phosphate cytidylyltransferase/2-C-methyl-D-erythritol 2,4-cyclodiphosphate synthase
VSSSAAARRVWAIVPAAGRGERFDSFRYGDIAKQYVPLLGATVLEWSLRALLAEPRIHAIVLVHAGADARWPSIAAGLDARKIQSAVGGASRQESVLNGLEHLANQAAPQDWILVHDAARPCLAAWELRALLAAIDAIDAAGAEGSSAQASGAVLAAPIVDTIKRDRGAQIETVDRQGLWRALTPQVFRLAQLRHALQDAARNGIAVTDEAQAIERLGMQSVLVPGSPFNIKLTRAEDLATAAGILTMTQPTKMRIGQGFDVHAFGDGDHVVLGGVTIPYPKGVVAHSDGDVVIHALCDALLGALGEGDIGRHFPDSDPRYRGADSRVFLREVAALMQRAGLSLVNADITVLAEAPRIAAHKAAMAANLAADLGVPAQRVNIKATTTERLGFIGRGEGLAASAAVLLDC